MKIRKVFSVIAGLALLSPLVAQRKPAAAAAPAARPAAPPPAVATTGSVMGSSAQGISGKVKRFSFGVNVGLKGNQASLGDTITKDGTIDTSSTTVANAFYNTKQGVMSDRNNAILKYNSGNTSAPYNMLSAYTEGGALTGIDFGGQGQYDLDDLINLPLFVRAAFNYQMTVSGGSQSRTLGDVSTNNPTAALLLSTNGNSPSDFAGGTMTSKFTSSSMEIPISVGFNARLSDKTKVYLGVGASWFNGGWDVKFGIDEKYANALATHVSTATTSATNYWKAAGGGSIDETVTFRVSGIGVNYFMGIEQMLTDSLSVFAELYASGFAKVSYSSELSSKLQKLLTATQSESLAKDDPNWFKRMAFPIVLGGASIKVGVKYYLF